MKLCSRLAAVIFGISLYITVSALFQPAASACGPTLRIYDLQHKIIYFVPGNTLNSQLNPFPGDNKKSISATKPALQYGYNYGFPSNSVRKLKITKNKLLRNKKVLATFANNKVVVSGVSYRFVLSGGQYDVYVKGRKVLKITGSIGALYPLNYTKKLEDNRIGIYVFQPVLYYLYWRENSLAKTWKLPRSVYTDASLGVRVVETPYSMHIESLKHHKDYSTLNLWKQSLPFTPAKKEVKPFFVRHRFKYRRGKVLWHRSATAFRGRGGKNRLFRFDGTYLFHKDKGIGTLKKNIFTMGSKKYTIGTAITDEKGVVIARGSSNYGFTKSTYKKAFFTNMAFYIAWRTLYASKELKSTP